MHATIQNVAKKKKKKKCVSESFKDYDYLHITRRLSPIRVWTSARNKRNRGSLRFR